MSKLVMMKGLPCSGKTEWATEWAMKKPNRVRLSWSESMAILGGRKLRECKLVAFDGFLRMMQTALRFGLDVVVDECNLNGLEFGIVLVRAQQCGAKIEWHTMKRTAEECKQRAREMGKPVNEMDIDRLAKKYEAWLKQ